MARGGGVRGFVCSSRYRPPTRRRRGRREEEEVCQETLAEPRSLTHSVSQTGIERSAAVAALSEEWGLKHGILVQDQDQFSLDHRSCRTNICGSVFPSLFIHSSLFLHLCGNTWQSSPPEEDLKETGFWAEFADPVDPGSYHCCFCGPVICRMRFQWQKPLEYGNFNLFVGAWRQEAVCLCSAVADDDKYVRPLLSHCSVKKSAVVHCCQPVFVFTTHVQYRTRVPWSLTFTLKLQLP